MLKELPLRAVKPFDERRWWQLQLGIGLLPGGPSAKHRRDLATRKVTSDLRSRGYVISIPDDAECVYDLVVERGGKFERVQVVPAESDWPEAGRGTIDLLAIYDRVTDCCYYIEQG